MARKPIEEMSSYETDSGAKGSLGIDEDGHLYWNGIPVVTEQKVKLAWWVNFAVIAGGLATVVIAVFTALMYFKTFG
jgi:hypothetical protein